MSLVKKSALAARKADAKSAAMAEPAAESLNARSPAHSPARPRRRASTAVERLGQAVEELASGLAEAAGAAAELQQATDHISTSAEEAAGGAQESLGLIGSLRGNFRESRERAAAAQRQVELVQSGFTDAAAQIEASVSAIVLNGERQLGSVGLVEKLEAAATTIVAIGETVADLSEQTGMLALNAAIEAARADEAGRGFAIIADEVRELADDAERNATEIRGLGDGIVSEVRDAAERIRQASALATEQADGGRALIRDLQAARDRLAVLVEGAEQIALASIEADTAATEAEKGAEQIAAAAEEQSAASAEARQAVEQQAVSLDQSQQTAEALSELVGRSSAAASKTDSGEVAEQIATAAEELSATVQELSGAAGQILVAVEQISRGAQVQGAATLQASAAMTQIERSATAAQARAEQASEGIQAVIATAETGRDRVAALVAGVSSAVEQTRGVLDALGRIGDTGRRIEKIGDGLALVALQTNMLAVSGAVEATRAGSAGVGFSTVTGDIRKLAREAAVNAQDVKDSVRAIQDQLSLLRGDLDQIAGAGETEAGRNRAMIERFSVMAENLSETGRGNAAILDGAQSILISVREIRSGTEQIATAAEISSGAARQASIAARQQAQGAEELAAAIEDIAALAASFDTARPGASRENEA
ncbi:methyl-accepting chemotaxis protein [Novosphingobium sp. ZW T3_23]|uniref:methyl-accepting chemotaxis protein n=1 Tax=Novosphingobium sp. ZW T3_23 TaxID=3378084 RepID=UPI00385320DA